jgi:hypothetical protein
MVTGELDGFGDVAGSFMSLCRNDLDDELKNPSDQRLLHLAVAFRRGLF